MQEWMATYRLKEVESNKSKTARLATRESFFVAEVALQSATG